MAIETIPNQPIIFDNPPCNFALEYQNTDPLAFQFKLNPCQVAENVVCNPNFIFMGDNLHPNGDFEDDFSGWTYSGTDVVWQRVCGTNCVAKCTTNSPFGFPNTLQYDGLPLVVGTRYCLRFTTKVQFTGTIFYEVRLGGLRYFHTYNETGPVGTTRDWEVYYNDYVTDGVDGLVFYFQQGLFANQMEISEISINEVCWLMNNAPQDDSYDIAPIGNQSLSFGDSGVCKTDTTQAASLSQSGSISTNTTYSILITIANYISGSINLTVGDNTYSNLSGDGTYTFLGDSGGSDILIIDFSSDFSGCVTNLALSQGGVFRIDILDKNNNFVATIDAGDAEVVGNRVNTTINIADYITEKGCYKFAIADGCDFLYTDLNDPNTVLEIDDYSAVSNLIKISMQDCCSPDSHMIKYRCNNSAFGFDFRNASFYFYLRIFAKITGPKYPETNEQYDYSSGTLSNIYFKNRKVKLFKTGYYPEYVHDCLAFIKGCNVVFIDDVEYTMLKGDYEPSGDDKDAEDFYKGVLEITATTQKNTIRNCEAAEPVDGEFLLDPQTGEFVRSFE